MRSAVLLETLKCIAISFKETLDLKHPLYQIHGDQWNPKIEPSSFNYLYRIHFMLFSNLNEIVFISLGSKPGKN